MLFLFLLNGRKSYNTRIPKGWVGVGKQWPVDVAIRISLSPHVMNRDQRAYNLSNIYMSLITTRNQSVGNSPSPDITRSRLQPNDGFR